MTNELKTYSAHIFELGCMNQQVYIKAEADKELRHQKYKRCLNKAEWCEERCARYDLLQEHSGFSWRREIDFYFRWHCRWLYLAEQFKDKEAK